MIIDNIRNSELYNNVNENVKKALEFLKNTDFSDVDSKRFEIDGSKVYASCCTVNKKPVADASWEVHKMYGDIHMVVEGEEDFGYDYKVENSDNLPYNENGDYVYDSDNGNIVKLKAGDFIVVFPQEPHMPAVTTNEDKTVKKIILKFLMD